MTRIRTPSGPGSSLRRVPAPAGFSDYPEHDHAGNGQEEVYVVLDGSAEFEVNGQPVSLDRQRMLWVGKSKTWIPNDSTPSSAPASLVVPSLTASISPIDLTMNPLIRVLLA
jgi:hypothetical protein